ncbi:hypothetical protein [Arenimonas donghaensis]|nr:hypothetical protein [Arenimonas donghaensis]
MIRLKTMVLAAAMAGACGAALASPVRATHGDPMQSRAVPAQVCSAMSVSKHYTLADADFGWVRERLNTALDQGSADPGRSLRKAAGQRIPDDATQFGIRLDHARCDVVSGPLHGEVLRGFAGARAKDCREAGCEDPLPGWTAPEGSTMAIWTCEGNVFREVVYERVNGTWRVKSVREELVVSCQVQKDPEEGREPRDGKN